MTAIEELLDTEAISKLRPFYRAARAARAIEHRYRSKEFSYDQAPL